MKKTKLSLLCTLLLCNTIHAVEELELLKVESSTINVHQIKKNEVSSSNTIDEAAKIMSSLALALKATAVGLVVAILSQIFYNILGRFAEVLESDYETKKI